MLPEPPAPKKTGWLTATLDKLSDEDKEYLVSVLNDKRFSGGYIARQMTAAGYPVTGATINNIRIRKSYE